MAASSKKPKRIGDTQARILVPSRRKDGGLLSRELRAEWESKAREQMEKLFLGTTPSQVHGAFQHKDGRCTREEITVLSSSCSRKKLNDKSARKELTDFAAELCAALGQESVFVGWGEVSYLVSRSFDNKDVPVVTFSSLSPPSQIVHLTMGWAGIDAPEKILQVLSLDGWTSPAEDSVEAKAQPWRLCGSIQEKTGERRAWAWLGDRSDLREGLANLKGDGPKEGDLVFSHGDPHYLEVSLVSARKLIGPRDLRLSHGQLNPVTRHLLFRILRREWGLLETDLKRKPLDQVFFPRLQSLRAAVEMEILSRMSHTEVGEHASTSIEKRPSRKVKKGKTARASAADKAFRESVLVVGRMMFLRFLIQKEWIPGGLERLNQQCRALGDDFYSKWIVPLWFDGLNQPEDQRSSITIERFGKDLPDLPP
jgi:hypothetical protein